MRARILNDKSPFETHDNEMLFLEKLRSLTLDNKIRVLDVGCGKKGGENQIEHYKIKKHLTKEIERITIDVAPYVLPDIVADASKLPFRGETFNIVFLESVLEHVPACDLTRILAESHRILKKNGLLLGWVPFYFPYHGSKDMPDLNRFTPEGVTSLFHKYSELFVEPSGGPISIVLKMGEPLIPILEKIRRTFVQRLESKIRDKRVSKYSPSVGIRFMGVKYDKVRSFEIRRSAERCFSRLRNGHDV